MRRKITVLFGIAAPLAAMLIARIDSMVSFERRGSDLIVTIRGGK